MTTLQVEPPLAPQEELTLTHAQVEGKLVYAIGDIHGCFDLLKALLAQIARDVVPSRLNRQPVLICMGDYVDRGPASAKVLSTLVWLQREQVFDLHLLKGNHEELMLAFCDDPMAARGWLSVGGAETLRSYGVEPPRRADDTARHWQARNELLDAMPASHLLLLQSLQLSVEIGDYAFVHAGIRPGVPLRRQVPDDLLWIREDFIDSAVRHEKLIVHGHTWTTERPTVFGSRIGIDTGAYHTGVLTAVKLEDGAMQFLQASTDEG